MSIRLPQQEYERRLELREVELSRYDRWDRWLGNARLVVFALALGMVWPTLWSQVWSVAWLVAAAVVLVCLVVAHVPLAKTLRRLRLGAAFYRQRLARMSGDLRDGSDDGAHFESSEHLYAKDLDLFGRDSLYALLCTSRSLPGRETLAAWLLLPAEPEEIGRRHEAVAELSGRLDLQEDMASLAADLSPQIRAEALDTWAGTPPRLSGFTVPLVAALLGAVNLASVGLWLFGPLSGRAVLPALAVSGLLSLACRSRTSAALAVVGVPAGELRVFSKILSRFERETVESSRLVDLQRRTVSAGVRPSERLLELARLIEWNDSRGNLFFQPIASLLLLGTQLGFAVERWRARNGSAIGDWLRTIGEFEALSALATFGYENPDYVFPEIVSGPPCFEGDSLVHPLLPRGTRVPNSVSLGGDGLDSALRLLLVSGSNMSGKSTFLRTVGVVAVLALAGAPVPAARLRMTPLAVGASLRVRDSLLEGVSRFYAELQQLRRIREIAANRPTLFLLDEVLHGTNSLDRRLGAAGILRGLLDDGAIGLVTTHDLALAQIADDMAPLAVNVHFEDHLEEGRMAFDYLLRPGVVEAGNALALMRELGLPVEQA